MYDMSLCNTHHERNLVFILDLWVAKNIFEMILGPTVLSAIWS